MRFTLRNPTERIPDKQSLPALFEASAEHENALIFRNALVARTAAIAIINGLLCRRNRRIFEEVSERFLNSNIPCS